jgi:hypothetical protein
VTPKVNQQTFPFAAKSPTRRSVGGSLSMPGPPTPHINDKNPHDDPSGQSICSYLQKVGQAPEVALSANNLRNNVSTSRKYSYMYMDRCCPIVSNLVPPNRMFSPISGIFISKSDQITSRDGTRLFGNRRERCARLTFLVFTA